MATDRFASALPMIRHCSYTSPTYLAIRGILATSLVLCSFALPAAAEVVIPDCRKLETFPYRGGVTDRDWLDFFKSALIDISPQDFDKIRTAMLTCASQKEGRMFARIDKDYFRRMYLDQRLDPIRARAAELQIDARSKAGTEELLAALESIGATLRPDVNPRPVLTEAQLAELHLIERKAADQDKTRNGKYLHPIRRAADSIRSANDRAISANGMVAKEEESKKSPLPNDKLPANAEVVIPDCRKLETFPYQGKVTDRDWLYFFESALIDISPQDFDKIRTAMLTCASQKEGRMFARIDKDYFRRMWLDERLDPIRARAAELQIDARSKAGTDELFAALESIGAILRPDVQPRPVLTEAQLAELNLIEKKAADRDKTRDKVYLHPIRRAADSIRSANDGAIRANQMAVNEEKTRNARLQENQQSIVMAGYTLFLVAELCTNNGFSFNKKELARIKAEVGKASDASMIPQEKKNQIWGTLKNVLEAQKAGIHEYACGKHREQLLFSMPHVFDDQSSTNPF